MGKLTTTHGVVDTPVFMSVGTQGSVKALDPRELREMGTQIILGNTYHLNLRPGLDIIRAAGGLHKFINWDLPILTDSGGFQVFSLAKIRKIKTHGVEFRSHVDGSLLFLGPKEAMEIQRTLGSDVAMVFDECPPHDAPAKEQRLAVHMRTKLDAVSFNFANLGEAEHLKAIELAEPHMPAHKARYAMGLGTPAQMVELVARGVDMFDCVLPTRVARNGTAYTRKGAIGIKGAIYKTDFGPIEQGCDCFACRHFTRAYLRHLLRVNEILGLRMLSVHNSHMYVKLMADVRAAIAAGTFSEFRREFIAGFVPSQRILSARAAASLER